MYQKPLVTIELEEYQALLARAQEGINLKEQKAKETPPDPLVMEGGRIVLTSAGRRQVIHINRRNLETFNMFSGILEGELQIAITFLPPVSREESPIGQYTNPSPINTRQV